MVIGTHWGATALVPAADGQHKRDDTLGPTHNPWFSARVLGFVSDLARAVMPALLWATEDDERCARLRRHGGIGSLHWRDASQQSKGVFETLDEPADVFGQDNSNACTCVCTCCEQQSGAAPSAVTGRGSPAPLQTPKNTACSLRFARLLPVAQRPVISPELVEDMMRLAGVPTGSSIAASRQDSAQPEQCHSSVDVAPAAYSGRCFTHADADADDDDDAESSSDATKTPYTSRSSESSTADDITTLDPATVSVNKLLTVNEYLLRRVRKLELENQVSREAYAEVHDILDCERRYNTTQLRALKRKHDEDMTMLVKEYEERARQRRSSSAQSFLSDSDSDDGCFGFRPGFTTTPAGLAPAVSASCTSSPLMGSSAGPASPPPTIRRCISDTTFATVSDSMSVVMPCELTIEFSASASGSDTEGQLCFDSDSDELSDDESASDTGSDSDSEADYNVDGDGPTIVFVTGVDDDSDAADTESSDGESGDEDDTGLELMASQAISETPTITVNTPAPLFSPNDYAHINPTKAVIDRYYPQEGRPSNAADIEDAAPEDAAGCSMQPVASPTVSGPTVSRSADSGGSVDATMPENPLSARAERTIDELDVEHNAKLPADQRIAKFVRRASSHLQQGARGGLSLGFMLHSLEVQAEKFAPNHVSVLCAFAESLYQLSEAVYMPDSSASPHRSAVSKRLRGEMPSTRQSMQRVARLLHTYMSESDDQQALLQQIEQLAEANSDVRVHKHALVLRVLYESELVDRSTIIRWYSSLPGESAAAAARGKLLREHASSLVVELASATADGAAKSLAAMEELHQQIQASSSSSPNVELSTPHASDCTASARAAHAFMGSLTPMSDDGLCKPSSRGSSVTSTSYVSVVCRTSASPDSISGIGHEGAGGTLAASVIASSGQAHVGHPPKPAKQVSFAADADELASKHHELLARMRVTRAPDSAAATPTLGNGAPDRHTDGFAAQRERRRNLTVGQRLGFAD
ncbi:hypothetical protein GGF46_000697 [Coemansia sp. RSA 552]|nr:hypothetical protein GGF46_000697 [Coemansia sp. RSA 552]